MLFKRLEVVKANKVRRTSRPAQGTGSQFKKRKARSSLKELWGPFSIVLLGTDLRAQRPSSSLMFLDYMQEVLEQVHTFLRVRYFRVELDPEDISGLMPDRFNRTVA